MYFGNFENEQDVISEFGLTNGELDNATILFAWYEYEDYSGSAFVLFERDGKYYEVHGSHCSCYGLSPGSGGDNQWDPEECSVESLKKTTQNSYYLHGVRPAWEKFLASLDEQVKS
ncbi:hypothetical protein [Pseudomonas phage PA1C]|nr:hypothetical protein [Pseudomonas phage PA1C]